tara:strand:+ start:899 stop:2062 length:1164 start_codon:yes stop_codon:yes gene_type:complete
LRAANIRGFIFNEKANYLKFSLLIASNTNILEKNQFRKSLIQWYFHHKRDLPWRKTNDPYKIWLSEIILQQTRVNQGLSYFLKFEKNYPNIKVLAEAEEDALMKDWEGLGYYSRARNLHSAAKHVQDELNGYFPNTYNEILKLKGVGEYTAAAISSFSFNEAHAVLDGNVFRFLSRIRGIDLAINSTEGKKFFKELAQDLLDKENPATYNQAIMEFGALQCKPKNPLCEECIFKNECKANALNSVDILPVKIRKVYNQIRNFHFFYLEKEGQLALERREEKDIWARLYQFPMFETDKSLTFSQALEIPKAQEILKGLEFTLKEIVDLKPHKLSHQTIYSRIYKIKLKNNKGARRLDWFSAAEINELGFPRPLRIFLDRNPLTLPFES